LTGGEEERFEVTVSKGTYLRLLMLKEQFKEVDPMVTLEDIIDYLISYEAGEVEK